MSRLTEEMVVARAKQSDLGLIKKLNCWGSDLADVNIIKRMHGVEVLALSVNKISTLAPFEDCTNLQELYLRKNNIENINEIAYLQNLPSLKYLWLEENPCCERVGPNYRAVVLRALPNLKKLDNVEVTAEELDKALRDANTGGGQPQAEEDVYEDARQQQQRTSPQQQRASPQHHRTSPQLQRASPQHHRASPQQQQQQPQQYHYPQHSPPHQQHQQQQHQQQYQQQQQPQQQQLLRRSSSPLKEPPQLASPLLDINTEGTNTNIANNVSDLYSNQVQNSMPPTPTKEPAHPPSPKYNTITKEQRTSFHQYDQSPGSDQDSPHVGYREARPTPLPPSISTHSMKEYYQSDRAPYASHYRHSQTDLTEWEENQQNSTPQVHHNPYGSHMQLHYPQRRSVGHEPIGDRYAYRNGNARENGGDWEVEERPRSRRPEGRYSDSVSNVSAVMNHYANCHRRPVNRNSNLLSAALCLVKELDYGSLEVVEHAVRCRLDEMAGE